MRSMWGGGFGMNPAAGNGDTQLFSGEVANPYGGGGYGGSRNMNLLGLGALAKPNYGRPDSTPGFVANPYGGQQGSDGLPSPYQRPDTTPGFQTHPGDTYGGPQAGFGGAGVAMGAPTMAPQPFHGSAQGGVFKWLSNMSQTGQGPFRR